MTTRILVLEAATEVASVALIVDGALKVQELVPSRNASGTRTEGMLPAIMQVLDTTAESPRALTAIICCGGPGGFTSLRSAAAIAKGMCSALRIPLYAVPTMELLIAEAHLPNGTYVTGLAAGREEYYTSTFRLEDSVATEISPLTLVSRAELDKRARAVGTAIVGPGFATDVSPRAGAVVSLLDRVIAHPPVDLDTWEPMYGRLAEAQVKWEAQHGRPLAV